MFQAVIRISCWLPTHQAWLGLLCCREEPEGGEAAAALAQDCGDTWVVITGKATGGLGVGGRMGDQGERWQQQWHLMEEAGSQAHQHQIARLQQLRGLQARGNAAERSGLQAVPVHHDVRMAQIQLIAYLAGAESSWHAGEALGYRHVS